MARMVRLAHQIRTGMVSVGAGELRLILIIAIVGLFVAWKLKDRILAVLGVEHSGMPEKAR